MRELLKRSGTLGMEKERMPRRWKAMAALNGRMKWVARARRCINENDGATVVETVVSTVIVMMLLFGVFDLALAFYTYHYVSDAAREGARYAVVRGSMSCSNTPGLSNCGASESEIGSYVESLAYPGIDAADNMTVAVYTCPVSVSSATGSSSWPSASCTEGMSHNQPDNLVKVKVTYAFPLSVPFWRKTTLDVSSTASMSIQQ